VERYYLDGKEYNDHETSERIRRAIGGKHLYKGQHSKVFLPQFIEVLREYGYAVNGNNVTVPMSQFKDNKYNTTYGNVGVETMFTSVNMPKTITDGFVSLLFGSGVKVNIDDNDGFNEWFRDWSERVKLHRNLIKAGRSQSFRGDAILKLRLKDSKAVISVIPSTVWRPILSEDDETEIIGHIIIHEYEEKNEAENETVKYIKAEYHTSGKAEYRKYALKDGRCIPVMWDGESTEGMILSEDGLGYYEDTGVPFPLVFRIPNFELDDCYESMSDYQGAMSEFCRLDIRMSQSNRILDKYAEPGMAGPPINSEPDPLTGQLKQRVASKYINVLPGEAIPQYITFNGDLANSYEMIERLKADICEITQYSRALVDIKSGSVPSGSALERMIIPTLKRVEEKATLWESDLKNIILGAMILEGMTTEGTKHKINIDFCNGLPEDETEEIDNIIKQVNSGLMSKETAIMELQDLDSEKALQEIERIKGDMSAPVPSFGDGTM